MSGVSNYVYVDAKPSIQEGDYRVEVVLAEKTVSSKGKEMIVVGLKPNGYDITVKDYIVEGDYFNNNMSRFFDAFPQIETGDFNFITWVGCVGACKFKKDAEGYLRVAKYLTPEQAKKLPEWSGKIPERQTVTTLEDNEDDIPF